MSCHQDIQGFLHEAENAVAAQNSTGDHLARIFKAISQCTELGDEGTRNDLALIIRDYLDGLHRQAMPTLVTLDDLRKRPPPKHGPIEWPK